MGFVAGFDPETDSPYVNYATPFPGAEPADRDIAALILAFRERGLRPRLEFAPDAAPAVEPALRRAGFRTEAVHEYLVCTPGSLVAPAGGGPGRNPAVLAPRTDEDYRPPYRGRGIAAVATRPGRVNEPRSRAGSGKWSGPAPRRNADRCVPRGRVGVRERGAGLARCAQGRAWHYRFPL